MLRCPSIYDLFAIISSQACIAAEETIAIKRERMHICRGHLITRFARVQDEETTMSNKL